MTNADSQDDDSGEIESKASESNPSESKGSAAEASDTDVTLKEIVSDMPQMASQESVKRDVLKITAVFSSVGVGFLFIMLAFGFSLNGAMSGDGLEMLGDFGLIIQLLFAMVGVLLVALLNPVLLSGLIGFEIGNKVEKIKPAVTTATIGCAIGVISLVVILIGGSAIGFAVIVPDEVGDISPGEDATESDGFGVEEEEPDEEDDGFSLSGGAVLLLFTGIAGGIAGGGSSYATKKFDI